MIIILLQICLKFSIEKYTKGKSQLCVPIETETYTGENF